MLNLTMPTADCIFMPITTGWNQGIERSMLDYFHSFCSLYYPSHLNVTYIFTNTEAKTQLPQWCRLIKLNTPFSFFSIPLRLVIVMHSQFSLLLLESIAKRLQLFKQNFTTNFIQHTQQEERLLFRSQLAITTRCQALCHRQAPLNVCFSVAFRCVIKTSYTPLFLEFDTK